MAKKITKEDNRTIKPDELKAILKKAQAQKDLASEHNGEQANILRSAIEQYGLDRTALAITRRLASFEESKRQATLRALLEYSAKMGFFAQTDAFDDIRDVVNDALSGDTPARTDLDEALIN